MRRCGYTRDETLHGLEAAFVNQTVALWWQEQGASVELISERNERIRRIECEINRIIEREHSWL